MRSVTTSHVIHQNIQDVWKALLNPDYLATYFASFKPLPPTLMARKESEGELKAGDLIRLTKRNGKALICFQVDACKPPHEFSIRNKPDEAGEFSNYMFKTTFSLENYGEGRTKATVTLVIIAVNSCLEFLTLCMPIRWIYYLGVNRALRKLGK